MMMMTRSGMVLPSSSREGAQHSFSARLSGKRTGGLHRRWHRIAADERTGSGGIIALHRLIRCVGKRTDVRCGAKRIGSTGESRRMRLQPSFFLLFRWRQLVFILKLKQTRLLPRWRSMSEPIADGGELAASKAARGLERHRNGVSRASGECAKNVERSS